VSSNGTLPISQVRARAVTALTPVDPTDPTVLAPGVWGVVDSVSPPALMLLWADPWLTPRTACLYDAQLEVLCIASRVEPEPGMDTLEQLVEYTLAKLQADSYDWPPLTMYAPRRLDIGQITYLGARLIFRVPVTA
jgi:hypothetical protein